MNTDMGNLVSDLEEALEVQRRIVSALKRNRISTTEVADCLDKSGALEGVGPLNPGHYCVGPVYWTYAWNESNWELHEQIRTVPEGAVVLVEPISCGKRAVFGSLVSKYLMLYRQAAGIVVRGYLRDVPHLIKENWPIWLEGRTPIGCFNRINEVGLDKEMITDRRDFFSGAIAVCDDSGVVIIPRARCTDSFLTRLNEIEMQEDVWFDCIDRRKWDTFETVCLKRYLRGRDEADPGSGR